MGTNRLEAFSDGVLAVAITLLVLDIQPPPVNSPGGLGHALGELWPNYAAYAISFITIGIIWVNHHVALSRLQRADHSILMINLLLLLSVGFLPFATSLMARYLRAGQGDHLAAAVYGGALLVMGLAFSWLNYHILLRRPHLTAQIAPAQRRLILRRSVSGVLPYLLATALAPLSAYLTLVICGMVAVYYARPIASGEPASESR